VADLGKGARWLPTTQGLLLQSSRPKGEHHDIMREEDGRSGVVRRQRFSRSAAAGNPCTENFAIMSVPPRPEESSNGDHALPHSYPLSTYIPNIKDCEPGSARRLALETRVLDGRAIGGWRVRPLAGFPYRYPAIRQEKAGEMAGKTFQRGDTS
jgi:hypothetical protein